MAVDMTGIAERLQLTEPGKWRMDARRLADKLEISLTQLEKFFVAV